jgi:hypothetical protein
MPTEALNVRETKRECKIATSWCFRSIFVVVKKAGSIDVTEKVIIQLHFRQLHFTQESIYLYKLE